MQKKFIALAVAGLVSGVAYAQSNVTIYGIIDLGYTNSSSHTTNGIKSRNAIDQGGQDGSRIGFMGTEDLGNGLSVSFDQQYRMGVDSRTGWTLNKQILSLNSKSWGSVRGGTYGSVHDDINGFSEVGGMGYGNSVLDVIYSGDTYNALQYVSPDFGGLQFKAGLSSNDQNADDAAGNGEVNARSYSGLVQYVKGGLQAGISYDRKKLDDGTLKEWLVSAGYDFGVVKVGAGYDRTRSEDYITAGEWTRKVWRLNIGAPIGASNAVALSYSRGKVDYASATDTKASGIGVSFTHMMSKRTNMYATYGSISQDDDNAFAPGYEKLFKVGLRHQF